MQEDLFKNGETEQLQHIHDNVDEEDLTRAYEARQANELEKNIEYIKSQKEKPGPSGEEGVWVPKDNPWRPGSGILPRGGPDNNPTPDELMDRLLYMAPEYPMHRLLPPTHPRQILEDPNFSAKPIQAMRRTGNPDATDFSTYWKENSPWNSIRVAAGATGLALLGDAYRKQSDSAEMGKDSWDPKFAEPGVNTTPEVFQAVNNAYARLRARK